MKSTLLEFLKKTPIRAHHLLLFRVSFALLTGIMLFIGDYATRVIFLTLYQFVFLVDYVDGPLARYRNEFSLVWQKRDRIAHYLIAVLFLTGIVWSHYMSSDNATLLTIGLFGSSSLFLTLIVDTTILQRLATIKKIREVHENKGIFYPIYSFLPIDAPFTFFYFLVVFDAIPTAIVFLSSLYFLILLKKIYTVLTWKKRT